MVTMSLQKSLLLLSYPYRLDFAKCHSNYTLKGIRNVDVDSIVLGFHLMNIRLDFTWDNLFTSCEDSTERNLD